MFRESDHPRDNDGKFTDGNGESGKSRSEKMIEAVKKYSDSPEKDLGGDADAIWDKPKAGTDKSAQLGIINATNPAPDDYHTWIRSEEDIKTPEEVYQSALDDGFEAGDKITPDFTMADWKNALDSGYITVYSSIKTGTSFRHPNWKRRNAQEITGYTARKSPFPMWHGSMRCRGSLRSCKS